LNFGHFLGVLPFYPLKGSGPPILFSIIIALGALRKTNFVWGESAHIWGSYGGLKSAILAYFGLFLLGTVIRFSIFFANRKYPQSSFDSENLKKSISEISRKVRSKLEKTHFRQNIFALPEALTMA